MVTKYYVKTQLCYTGRNLTDDPIATQFEEFELKVMLDSARKVATEELEIRH